MSVTRLFYLIAPDMQVPQKLTQTQFDRRELQRLCNADSLDGTSMNDGVHEMVGDNYAHQKGKAINLLATRYLAKAHPGTEAHIVRGTVVIIPKDSIV